jgi:hypothetical protein
VTTTDTDPLTARRERLAQAIDPLVTGGTTPADHESVLNRLDEIIEADYHERKQSQASGATLVIVSGVSRSRLGGVWGTGASLAEATKSFRSHGGATMHGYEVIAFGPDSTFLGVDGMGRYTWRGPRPAEWSVPATKASR